ncbi:MAG: glycosyltransferase family 2 protein [Acidimicrobiales bacterium]
MSERHQSPAGDISVVIATHDARQWDRLARSVTSVQSQTSLPLETIVVVDHNESLLARVRSELSGVMVTPNTRTKGASGARNAGTALARGGLVAFLDDDAYADPWWLARMAEAVRHPAVVGVGGRIAPAWDRTAPSWFPEEFAWVVGGTYRGLPEAATPVRNVWSGNMVIRRSAFEAVGGFREGFGKVGGRSRPEDTELCIRVTQETGGVWVYDPSALVHHAVPIERATVSYFLRRCFAEGRGKAALMRLVGNGEGLRSERNHALRLPRAIWREALGGGPGGLRRGLAIGAGLVAATSGLVVEGAGRPR